MAVSLAVHGILLAMLTLGTQIRRPPELQPTSRVTRVVLRVRHSEIQPLSPAPKMQVALPQPGLVRSPREFTPAVPRLSPASPAVVHAETSLPEAPAVVGTSLIPSQSAALPQPQVKSEFGGVEQARYQNSTLTVHRGTFGESAVGESGRSSAVRVRTGGLMEIQQTSPLAQRTVAMAVGGLATAAFRTAPPASPRPHSLRTTAVSIDYKPNPAYTDEARRLRIEGEVIVSVRFKSSGQAEALDILQKLGHGLDESSLAAVAELRFHPGTQDGIPTDQIAAVHFIFRLAY